MAGRRPIVLGYAPMGGQDQVSAISERVIKYLKGGRGVVGIESGMGSYTAEGHLTHFEYEQFSAALPDARLINAHDIVDRLSLIKDPGTINRFREASRIVDLGQQAVYAAIQDDGYRGMTETEITGIATYAMRKAGSEFEWTFTGGNEIASGYRTGFAGGACTPATRRELLPGETLMVDLHAMFKGRHSYLKPENRSRTANAKATVRSENRGRRGLGRLGRPRTKSITDCADTADGNAGAPPKTGTPTRNLGHHLGRYLRRHLCRKHPTHSTTVTPERWPLPADTACWQRKGGLWLDQPEERGVCAARQLDLAHAIAPRHLLPVRVPTLSHGDLVATPGNTDGEIGAPVITDSPTQPEVQALRDKGEELADDVRVLFALVHALQASLLHSGLIKGGAP